MFQHIDKCLVILLVKRSMHKNNVQQVTWKHISVPEGN
jgi:hypothetical protein